MADNETKPDERLEHLLRRWGANEAVSGADVSGLTAPQPSAVRSQWLWRWMPLAASLVLVAGAATVFFADHEVSSDAAPAPRTSPAATAQIEKLKAEAAKLRTDLAAAMDQLAAMEVELAQTAKLRADLARAKKQLAKSEAELAEATIQLYGKEKSGENGRNVAALQAALHKAQTALNEQEAWFKSEIARMGREKSVPGAEMEMIIAKRVDKALKELDRDWTRHQKKMAELKKQLVEERKTHVEEATALRVAREKTRIQMTEMRTDLMERIEILVHAGSDIQREMLQWFRHVYLSAVAPGKEGYAARQHAARERRLLERCAELRLTQRSVEQRKAFDRIEALLTRLDLLDVHDEAAVERFRALVKRVVPMTQMGILRAPERATPDIGNWVLEVTLVLTEMRYLHEP